MGGGRVGGAGGGGGGADEPACVGNMCVSVVQRGSEGEGRLFGCNTKRLS